MVVGVEAGEQLVAEVLDDEVVVAPERSDEALGVARVLEGETGEDEARGPALGAVAQLGEQVGVEGGTGATEQAGRLLGGEPEVLRRGSPPPGPRTRNRPIRNGGSMRVASTTVTCGGHRSTRRSTPRWIRSSSTRW